uniref:CFA20 domain-containing protein n=1 Tax=Hyaloperonospora arabidopsidis (strain Emoy2) TaxID=559515 RepID=M4BKY9_HYAAE
MFAQTCQSGFISLLYSIGARPLQLCEKHEETPGSIRRVLDDEVQSSVVELLADNLVHTWIRFPSASDEDQEQQQLSSMPWNTSLHIRLQHLVLVLKNLGQHISLEVQMADDQGTRRRFRFSTFQTKTAVHPQITLLPLRLDEGWNQLQLDLVDLALCCYNARYAHTISVQLHASCRVRRIYFAEQMFSEAQLPAEFRLYKRLSKAQTQQFHEQDCGRAQQQ